MTKFPIAASVVRHAYLWYNLKDGPVLTDCPHSLETPWGVYLWGLVGNPCALGIVQEYAALFTRKMQAKMWTCS